MMHELASRSSQEKISSEIFLSFEGYQYRIVSFASGVIQIFTETRELFLQKGGEYRVHDSLVRLAKGIREEKGGFFEIDPWFGAVRNSRVYPLLPLGPGTNHINEVLSMRIISDGIENPNLEHECVAKKAGLLGRWRQEFNKFNSHLRQFAALSLPFQ